MTRTGRDRCGKFSGSRPARSRDTLTPVEFEQMRGYRRAMVRSELLADGLTGALADRWISAWEAKNQGDPSTPAFWASGLAWITSEAAGGLEPPPVGDSPGDP